jgi:hypothetical protein
MSTVLAIDPGTTESAYVVIDRATHRPLSFGKIPNLELRDRLWTAAPSQIVADRTVIEMVASYGMAVGKEVFETCVWIGRFHTASECATGDEPRLVYRREVKLHHCHNSKAKDSNISQALVDRFASGVRNRGKGTKAEPGWFYGFHDDIWQAYALAVLVADSTPDAVPATPPIPSVAGTAPIPVSAASQGEGSAAGTDPTHTPSSVQEVLL